MNRLLFRSSSLRWIVGGGVGIGVIGFGLLSPILIADLQSNLHGTASPGRAEEFLRHVAKVGIVLNGLPAIGLGALLAGIVACALRHGARIAIPRLGGVALGAALFALSNAFAWWLGIAWLRQVQENPQIRCGTPFIGFLALDLGSFLLFPLGFIAGWGILRALYFALGE